MISNPGHKERPQRAQPSGGDTPQTTSSWLVIAGVVVSLILVIAGCYIFSFKNDKSSTADDSKKRFPTPRASSTPLHKSKDRPRKSYAKVPHPIQPPKSHATVNAARQKVQKVSSQVAEPIQPITAEEIQPMLTRLHKMLSDVGLKAVGKARYLTKVRVQSLDLHDETTPGGKFKVLSKMFKDAHTILSKDVENGKISGKKGLECYQIMDAAKIEIFGKRKIRRRLASISPLDLYRRFEAIRSFQGSAPVRGH